MPMNPIHRIACSSRWWRGVTTTKVIPWVIGRLDLGDHTLEIGPGYGANLHALKARTQRLTVVEVDENLATRLQARFGAVARIVHGDGTAMPFADGEFSAVVSCNMLHHVPSVERQDALFAEALRVLRPGGAFAGSDGISSPGFRLIHIGDTCVAVDPTTLPDRLRAVGFTDVRVDTAKRHFRFRAVKPEHVAAAASVTREGSSCRRR
jgi:SAM-dependent methyltransferase